DIFYHHRPDPDTPLEETLGALDLIVKQGKALYAGVSNYRGLNFVSAVETMKKNGWSPIAIHQPLYNMTNRWIEKDLLKHTDTHGAGVIVFSPLAQGMLTSKYLDPSTPIPVESRAADPDGYLKTEQVTSQIVEKVRVLAKRAEARGQAMAQFALAWTLRDPRVTSAIIGARNAQQIVDCVKAIENLAFSKSELDEIDKLFPE
ncbi:MAG TPA: aldo/keto reductase, partial [Candidatus Hydrogenedentes bacterium]|nr:aldo/keto reductase [Candidatus Hydrogenedentota bacterium]